MKGRRFRELPEDVDWAGEAGEGAVAADFTSNYLTTIPEGVIASWAPWLQELFIGANEFRELPSGLKSLPHLRVLRASSNGIRAVDTKDLPPSLKTLDLRGNLLTSFTLSGSAPVTWLSLACNRLESFTVEGSAGSEVEYLGLYGNQLKAETFDLGAVMKSLPRLRRIMVGGNVGLDLSVEDVVEIAKGAGVTLEMVDGVDVATPLFTS